MNFQHSLTSYRAITAHYFSQQFFTIPSIAVKKAQLLVAVFLVVFGMVYIWQVNSMANVSYTVSDLENKAFTLQKQNEALTVQVAEARSTATIKGRLDAMGMEQVYYISYVQDHGDAVALAK